MFVNGKEIYKFKADSKNANFPTQCCLGNISNKFDAVESKEVSLKGNVYDVKDYMLFCDHIVSHDDFKILRSSNSEYHLKIKESLLISRDTPELNRNEKPLPLCLFNLCIPSQILCLYRVLI